MLTPWSFSTTTIWIDKLCIDQTDDETKAAGVAGFKRFLGQCDKMVALISPNYFSRASPRLDPPAVSAGCAAIGVGGGSRRVETRAVSSRSNQRRIGCGVTDGRC